MTYTLWHNGIRMGESTLSDKSRGPKMRIGIFEPTEYGLTLMPRITGILTATHELTRELESLGKSITELTPKELEKLFTSTRAGLALTDVGRVLSQVELRGPNRKPLEFVSIAFSDIDELRRLGTDLGVNLTETLDLAPSASQAFIVSVTLCSTPGSKFFTFKRIFDRHGVQ